MRLIASVLLSLLAAACGPQPEPINVETQRGINCATGGTHGGCRCELDEAPNTFSCDEALVGDGMCCASDGWPNGGSCECFAVSCSKSGGICECEYGTARGSDDLCSGGGVCCDFGYSGCSCYDHLDACPSGIRTVDSCSADTMGCGAGRSRVASCSG